MVSAGQRILRVLLSSGSQYLDCLVSNLRLQSAATGPGAGARQLNLRVKNSVGNQEVVTPQGLHFLKESRVKLPLWFL